MSCDKEIKIAPLTESDLYAVSELEKANFSLPFSEKALNELFTNTSWHFLGAKQDNVLVGYIIFYTIIDETEIVNVCVRSDLRGLGIGRALLTRTVALCRKGGTKKLMLEVRKSNSVAIKLYESLGFIPVGVSKNHYKLPTEDAILMNLEF